MNLSVHALSTPATAAHTFYILNIYSGHKYECRLQRETACYYIVEVTGILSGHRVAVRRFHKATMCIDELCLYIRNTTEDKAAARAEVAQRIAAVKAAPANIQPSPTCGDRVDYIPSPTMTQALKETATIEATHTDPGGPIAHDAPHFCTNCETYAKHDEMIVNDATQLLVCIDCDDALDTAARERLTTIKNVALLNYTGGHLPGYNFTPTLKELPRNLIAFRPNTGRPGSPNALVNYHGFYIVKPTPTTAVRVLYNELGFYLTHGDYDTINAVLQTINEGL